MPSGDRISGVRTVKKPRVVVRRTSPGGDVQSDSGRRIPVTPPPRRAPVFGPLRPVAITSPRRRPVRPVLPDPRQVVARDLQRAATARRQQVISRARQDLVFGPGSRRMGPVDPRPFYGPPAPPVRALHDSGPVGQSPSVRGVVLSPQRLAADAGLLLRKGATGRTGAVERLQAAGYIDRYGTTTRRQAQEATNRQRKAVEDAFIKQYRYFQKHASYGLGVFESKSDRTRHLTDGQLRAFLKNKTADQILNVLQTYKPTGIQTAARGVQNQAGVVGRSLLPQRRDSPAGRLPGEAQTAGVFDPSGAVALARLGVGAFGLGTATIGAGASALAGGGVAGNALKDAAMLPMAAIPVAAMAVDDPSRLWEGVKGGLIGSLVQGKGDQARRVLREHPLFSVLEMLGAKSAVGRTVGAVGRGIGGPESRFSTARAPLSMDGIPYQRSYSRDASNQAIQRLYDRTLADGPVVPSWGREVPSKMAPVGRRGLDKHGRSRHLLALADYAASRTNSLNRRDRAVEAQFARRAAPTRTQGDGVLARIRQAVDRSLPSNPVHQRLAKVMPDWFYRPERDVVSLVIEQVVRRKETFVGDLRREARRVQAQIDNPRTAWSHPLERNAAKEKVDAINRVLNDPRAVKNAGAVIDSARALSGRLNELEAEAIKAGVLDPAAASRAKLFPASQAHLGAVPSAVQRPVDPRTAETIANLRNLADRGATPGERQAAEAALQRRIKADREQRSAPLPNDEITQMLRDRGVDPSLIAHLPHNMKLRGQRAFYQQAGLSRANYQGDHNRTGSMFERGSSPFDYTHILETLVGRRTTLSNIHALDRVLGEIGIRGKDGKYLTAAEAEHIINNRGYDSYGNFYPGYEKMKAVRAFNSRRHDAAKANEAQGVRADDYNTGSMEEHFADRMNMRAGDGARNVVLVPKVFADRIQEHLGSSGALGKTGQMISSGFRRTVLPFSTKWMFGNVFEAALRLAVRGGSPLDPMVPRRVMRSMYEQDARAMHGAAAEPIIRAARDSRTAGSRVPFTQARKGRRAAQERLKQHAPRARAFEAEHYGGLLFADSGVRRTAGETLGNRAAAWAAKPGFKEIKDSTIAATDAAFAFNRAIERQGQLLASGKFMRARMQEFSGSWIKALRMQQTAIDQVAKGLLHTPEQQQLARYMYETLGQYQGFSPGLRNSIQTFAPFLPWYLNAARFVAVTLPVHHPLKTAVLARAEDQFSQDYKDQHKDVKGQKGNLMTAIRRKDGGFVDLAHYTPFSLLGTAATGDWGDIASPLLPQAASLVNAFKGLDPFDKELKTRDLKTGKMRTLTQGEHAMYVLRTLGEELIPGASIARRLQEHGGTSDPVSSIIHPRIKQGSAGSLGHGVPAWQKVFSPVAPIYLRDKTAGGPAGLPAEVTAVLEKIDAQAATALPSEVQKVLDKMANAGS